MKNLDKYGVFEDICFLVIAIIGGLLTYCFIKL